MSAIERADPKAAFSDMDVISGGSATPMLVMELFWVVKWLVRQN
jgi:hypothetical protein